MPSDLKRVQQVMRHIARIRAGDYPAVIGRDGDYRIVERPWQDLGEAAKLAILQGAVDWSGVTNRDQAHILLAEIDPGRITDAQRNRLIDMAAVKVALEEKSNQHAREGEDKPKDRDRGLER